MTSHKRAGRKAPAMPRPDESYASFMGLPAVYAHNVGKSFGDKVVLRDIDFMINKGEVVSLIGPSGAGKSTMLRCLTLLDTFDAGQLSYGTVVVCQPDDQGRATYEKDAMQQARMRFGIVFQNYNLFPHYTVLQNVTDAPVVVQGRPKDEVEAEARQLLDRLGLADQADKVPCQLSGGQQQRVAIARALAMKPHVIYFDEATSALDPKLTEDMRRLVRELAADGMAVGIVTHEMGFAREVSDRVCFLFDGQIAEQGTPEEVLAHPQDPRTQSFLAHDAE